MELKSERVKAPYYYLLTDFRNLEVAKGSWRPNMDEPKEERGPIRIFRIL